MSKYKISASKRGLCTIDNNNMINKNGIKMNGYRMKSFAKIRCNNDSPSSNKTSI